MINETVPEGFQKTEVGIIPIDWSVVRIGDVFKFKNGLNKEKRYFGEGTPIVNYMDVYRHNGIKSQNLFGKVTLSNQEIKMYEVQKGDVFFTRTSETVEEIGITAVVLDELQNTVFSGFILRARPFRKVFEIPFCQFCFSSNLVRKQILTTASYTTRALTNGRLLSDIKIPLPPTKAEQTAIATVLNDADALIQKLEQLIAKKRLIKQGAMQELLKPKDDWEVKKLAETCDVRDGTHDSPKYFKNGVIFITSKNILNGKLDFTEVSYISDEDAVQINKRSKVDKNDILMSMIGTIGNSVLIDFEPNFCIKNVALFKPKNVESKFLIQILNSDSFRNYLFGKLDGGIQKFVSLGVMRELEISIPKFKTEQTRIAQILSDMDAEIEALETKLVKYKMLKQGMMQSLLTGKIRLVNAESCTQSGRNF